MTKQQSLAEEVKTFIVQQLACFKTPSGVAKAVKAEFSVDVSRQAIQVYDPTSAAGRDLGAEMKAVFESTRARFLEETADIGLAHKAVRLRMLDRMATVAEERGNMALAAQLLEQCAKEMGGAYTNRRELTGKGGKDLTPLGAGPGGVFLLPHNGREVMALPPIPPDVMDAFNDMEVNDAAKAYARLMRGDYRL